MSTEVETNDNASAPIQTEEIKFTERMRKATRKEHRISDALINAKMTIGKIFNFIICLINETLILTNFIIN